MTNKQYNSNKYGKATGLRFPDKDPVTGLYLQHSNGCFLHKNCFTCPFPDCRWTDHRDDRKEGKQCS